MVPTTSVLQRLIETGATTAAEVGAAIRMRRSTAPRVADLGPAAVEVTFSTAGGLPGRIGRAVLRGRRELILVDPGDPSDAALDAIAGVVARHDGAIRAIVLTSTDPDHAAGAEALAIPLGIPILVAPGAGRHLPYETVDVGDGERLPADIDLRVRVGPAGSGRLEVEASAGE